ncbi:MAG: hypothetical protein ACYDCX_12015 [Acidithiobacillus sp.]
MNNVIKDNSGAVIGYVETLPGGKQIAKNKDFVVKGYYDPKTEITTDASLKPIGKGNLLSSLIFRGDKNGR